MKKTGISKCKRLRDSYLNNQVRSRCCRNNASSWMIESEVLRKRTKPFSKALSIKMNRSKKSKLWSRRRKDLSRIYKNSKKCLSIKVTRSPRSLRPRSMKFQSPCFRRSLKKNHWKRIWNRLILINKSFRKP